MTSAIATASPARAAAPGPQRKSSPASRPRSACSAASVGRRRAPTKHLPEALPVHAREEEARKRAAEAKVAGTAALYRPLSASSQQSDALRRCASVPWAKVAHPNPVAARLPALPVPPPTPASVAHQPCNDPGGGACGHRPPPKIARPAVPLRQRRVTVAELQDKAWREGVLTCKSTLVDGIEELLNSMEYILGAKEAKVPSPRPNKAVVGDQVVKVPSQAAAPPPPKVQEAPKRAEAEQAETQEACSAECSAVLLSVSGKKTLSFSKDKAPGKPKSASHASSTSSIPPAAAASSSSSSSASTPRDAAAAGTQVFKQVDGESCRLVFEKLKDNDCTIFSECLSEALHLCGYRPPQKAWIQPILRDHFKGRAFLDEEDFDRFIELYRDCFMNRKRELYSSCRSFKICGKINLNDMAELLQEELIQPMPGMVREIAAEITHTRIPRDLTFEEYLQAFDMVRDRSGFLLSDLAHLTKTFHRFDKDQDGLVNTEGVYASLYWMGFMPLMQDIEELAREVWSATAEYSESKYRKADSITEAEYLHIMRKYLQRNVLKARAAFDRWDSRRTGMVCSEEIPAILEVLGYGAVAPEVVHEALGGSKVDRVASETKTRRNAMRRNGRLSMSADSRRSTNIRGTLALAALSSSDPLAMASASASEPSSGAAGRRTLDIGFDDFYMIMERIRATDGFLEAECEEIEEACTLFADSTGEGVDILGTHLAISWLGYPISLWGLQSLINETDPDKVLSRREFIDVQKLCALLRTNEVHCVRQMLEATRSPRPCKTCREPTPIPGGTACRGCGEVQSWHSGAKFQASDLGKVYLKLGYEPPPSEEQRSSIGQGAWRELGDKLKALKPKLKDAKGACSAGLSIWEVMREVKQHRIRTRMKARSRENFSLAEYSRFERNFQEMDVGKTGKIKHRALAHFLEGLFPEIASNRAVHEKVRSILEEADADHDHELDMAEFMLLMRKWRQCIREARIDREKQAVEESRFTWQEVGEFRRIFCRFDRNGSGELEVQEFGEMLGQIILPVTLEQDAELQRLIDSVDADNSGTMDFGEFLIAMRKVLDENWCRINEAARAAVRRQSVDR